MLCLGDLIRTPNKGFQPIVEIEVDGRRWPKYYTRNGYGIDEDDLRSSDIIEQKDVHLLQEML